MITIHEIGKSNRDIFYTIFNDKSIMGSDGKSYNLSSLEGDFEPYSFAHLYRYGYITMTDDSKSMHYTILNLYNKFDAESNCEDYETDIPYGNRHHLCGYSFITKTHEHLSYYPPSSGNIEVIIDALSNIYYKNDRRIRYGKEPFPFIEGLPEENNMYVSFISCFDSTEQIDEKIECALNDLMSHIPDCKWTEVKLPKHIYL